MVSGMGFGALLGVVPRVEAVFVIVTSTLILRTGTLRHWVAYFGYAIALPLLLVPIISKPLGFGFPVWVAVVSLALFVRTHDARATEPAD